MKPVRSESGSVLTGPLLFIAVIFFVALAFYFMNQDNEANEAIKNFEKYFGVHPHTSHNETQRSLHRSLIKPFVEIKLHELLVNAQAASGEVQRIQKEPISTTSESLKEKLARLKTSEEKEKSAWADWRIACSAAKFEKYVEKCDAAK